MKSAALVAAFAYSGSSSTAAPVGTRVLALAGGLERLAVDDRQQRLVVEHLFEVGIAPVGGLGVAAEPAIGGIEEPAAGHPSQRGLHHRERLPVPRAFRVTEKEQEILRRRELRRRAEAAVLRVELRDELAVSGVEV